MLWVTIYYDIKLGSTSETQMQLSTYPSGTLSPYESQVIHLIAEVPLHHSCSQYKLPCIAKKTQFLNSYTDNVQAISE